MPKVQQMNWLSDVVVSDIYGPLGKQPVGPMPDCLPAAHLARIILSGASEEDLRHLESCSTCREIASVLPQLDLETSPEFVARAMSHASTGPRLAPDPAAAPVSTSPLPMIIGLVERTLKVHDLDSSRIAMRCTLIPAFKRSWLKSLDCTSLKLDGAIIARDAKCAEVIDVNEDGTDDLVRVAFQHGKLSPELRKGLQGHSRFSDRIRISGRLGTDPSMEFVGQADIEFAL